MMRYMQSITVEVGHSGCPTCCLERAGIGFREGGRLESQRHILEDAQGCKGLALPSPLIIQARHPQF